MLLLSHPHPFPPSVGDLPPGPLLPAAAWVHAGAGLQVGGGDYCGDSCGYCGDSDGYCGDSGGHIDGGHGGDQSCV